MLLHSHTHSPLSTVSPLFTLCVCALAQQPAGQMRGQAATAAGVGTALCLVGASHAFTTWSGRQSLGAPIRGEIPSSLPSFHACMRDNKFVHSNKAFHRQTLRLGAMFVMLTATVLLQHGCQRPYCKGRRPACSLVGKRETEACSVVALAVRRTHCCCGAKMIRASPMSRAAVTTPLATP